jgi:hypothetical protein
MHLSGEVVDTVADYIAIFVLVFVPSLLIYLFWMVHILPEKIAERKHHPQLPAIKTLCLLSLAFGGMLWPIAWIWAYSKPVVHKLAYGTDRIAHDEHDVIPPAEPADLAGDAAVQPAAATDLAEAGAASGRR